MLGNVDRIDNIPVLNRVDFNIRSKLIFNNKDLIELIDTEMVNEKAIHLFLKIGQNFQPE